MATIRRSLPGGKLPRDPPRGFDRRPKEPGASLQVFGGPMFKRDHAFTMRPPRASKGAAGFDSLIDLGKSHGYMQRTTT